MSDDEDKPPAPPVRLTSNRYVITAILINKCMRDYYWVSILANVQQRFWPSLLTFFFNAYYLFCNIKAPNYLYMGQCNENKLQMFIVVPFTNL